MHPWQAQGLEFQEGRRCSLFETEAKGAKHKVTLYQKIDRSLPLIMQELSWQVVTAKVYLFGRSADESKRLPEGHLAVMAAVHFMTPIAQKLADGQIDCSQLSSVRKESLRKICIVGHASSKIDGGEGLFSAGTLEALKKRLASSPSLPKALQMAAKLD